MGDPTNEKQVAALRAVLERFVPDGYRDDDGIWHDGPLRRDALATLDALSVTGRPMAEPTDEKQAAEVAIVADALKIGQSAVFGDGMRWQRFDSAFVALDALTVRLSRLQNTIDTIPDVLAAADNTWGRWREWPRTGAGSGAVRLCNALLALEAALAALRDGQTE